MLTERLPARPELAGQQVAFTGRLASMSRRAAAELVAQLGGMFSAAVNRGTSLVVVGREGWPLRPDGRLTRKLRRAHQLIRQGQALAIVPEEQFLKRIGAQSAENQFCRESTVAELTGLLALPRRKIESWERCGLIRPSGHENGLARYDFRQVAAVRSLVRLLSAGVQPKRLFRNLRQLESWIAGDAGHHELLMRLLYDGRRLFLRTDRGQLVETTGQMLLEFEAEDASATVPWQRVIDSDRLFEEAARLEQEGDLQAAASRYRQLLLEEGPDPDVCFNLANVLYSLGEKQAAIERFYEAVSLDREYADAWHNLGNMLAEQNRHDEALAALRRAVAIEPDYGDAHYALADTLEQLGRFDEARPHWKAYVSEEQSGPWADYARSRLASHTAG
jgi:tetratricopeptide (TPR) repeat protein